MAEDFVALGQVGRAHALPQERHTIKFLVRLDPGQVEHGRAKVDEAHEAVRSVAPLVIGEVPEILRDAHDQRHVQATLVGVALAARHHPAVIAEVKHERVLEQPVLGELLHDAPDMAINDFHPVKIARLGVAHDWRVGKVRLQLDIIRRRLGWLLHLFQREMQPALMRVGKRLHVKERHVPVWSIAPTGLAGGHVPRLLHVDLEVVVGLGVVCGVVALLPQHCRPRLHARGQVGQGRFAVILKTDTWRVHRRGQGRPCDGADRSTGEGMVERQPLGGQALDIRRHTKPVAVQPQVVDRVVLRYNKDKIGPLGRLHRVGQAGQQTRCKQAEHQSRKVHAKIQSQAHGQ